jgi:ABC-type glycerol-3-phosphate transport system substrate-binding protein
MFVNGDLAFYFGFASEYLAIKDKNPNLNFSVAILPQASATKVYQTVGQISGLAIMKGSSNPSGAYTVISALTSAEAFPFWSDLFNLPSARRDILSQSDKSAVKTIFNKSAIMSQSWLDPNKQLTNTIFQDMVESYSTGRANLSQAISLASDRLDDLLAQ